MTHLTQKVLFLDLEACTACRACMVACSVAKEKVFSLNKVRIWVPKRESIGLGVPIICEQCDPAPCMVVCPMKAISRHSKTGAPVVDREKCIACKECVWACPFGAINVQRGVAVKCDLCEGKPACAEVCMPGAIKYLELERPYMQKKWKSLERRVEALSALFSGGS